MCQEPYWAEGICEQACVIPAGECHCGHDTMATLGTGGKKETTEWEDILRSKGILPEKTPDELANDVLKGIVQERVESYDPHANKDVAELDEELEDADSEEEAILNEYRNKRIEQMKADACRRKFGPGVEYVAAEDWKAQVTEAGESVFVVVHLVSPGWILATLRNGFCT